MYFLKRLLFIAPLLLLVSMVAFGIMRLAPGGPFDRERAPASPEIERAVRARYHLDDPLWKQYLRYLGLAFEPDPGGGWRLASRGLLQGDLGPSLKYRSHGVNDIVAQALPVSATLGAMAFLFALAAGIPLGWITAVRRGRWADWLGSVAALLCVCVPAMVVGPVAIMIFALRLGWLPPALWDTPAHVILPTFTLGLYFAGRVARLLREGLLETLRAKFLVTARAKGLSENAVLRKHAFRLAILPVLTYSGPLLADLLTGSFVVENIFRIPGIGVFLVNSALSRDYPMVIGLVVVYAALLLLLNLLVDLIHGALDPRIRHG